MAVQQLDEIQAARLRAAAYIYEPVGQTADGPGAGVAWFERSAQLVRRDFEDAAEDLFMWRLHQRAGLRVRASDAPLRADTVLLMRLGLGPMSLRIPCRVVYVVDEPDLRGFAYGTLPGHPEAGEERFVVRRNEDGSIGMTVSGFSRPASRLARLGGRLSSRLQDIMTERYLRALDLPD